MGGWEFETGGKKGETVRMCPMWVNVPLPMLTGPSRSQGLTGCSVISLDLLRLGSVVERCIWGYWPLSAMQGCAE